MYDVIIQIYHRIIRFNNKIFIVLIGFLCWTSRLLSTHVISWIGRRGDYEVHSITLYIEKPKA